MSAYPNPKTDTTKWITNFRRSGDI